LRVAGIDFSSRAVDVVLVDEAGRAEWHRFELVGADAFDRARRVRDAMPSRTGELWDDVLAVGIEEPRGPGNGSLLRIQGAVLASLPVSVLVQPFTPNEWRVAVGLPGNAAKHLVRTHTLAHVYASSVRSGMQQPDWPQDACDAYCLALAVRSRITTVAA
jgi:hypothetical protein